MTKQDLIDRLYGNGIPKNEAADLVDCVLDLMKDTLVSGDEVKIAGFGKWEISEKNDRRGRNPQTGEEITIAARRIVSFRPSQILKAKVNGGPTGSGCLPGLA